MHEEAQRRQETGTACVALPADAVLPRRRLLGRAVELGGVFFLLPATLYALRELGVAVPTIPTLLAVAFGLAFLLARDPAFDLRSTLRWRFHGGESRRILALFGAERCCSARTRRSPSPNGS